MKKSLSLIFIFLTAGILTGCHHKDLYYGSAQSKVIEVIFDWRDAPEANPASMALYLFPTDGGTPLRYEFTGRDGGTIRVPFGKYDALCMNSDNTTWIHLTETDRRYAFGLHVGELTENSDGDESIYASLFRQVGKASDGNLVDENPQSLWTGSSDAFEVLMTPETQILTMVPEDALCYYTVDIIDVEGIEDLEGKGVPALLTGMSDGVDALTRTSSTNHISSPFILQTPTRSGTLHSEFQTFGEDAAAMPIHQIKTMVEQSDGKWNLQTIDVTDQVHTAQDPHHVHIMIQGMKIPHNSDGGLKIDVDEWESENITLKM